MVQQFPMSLVSVNVGLPQVVEWRGRKVATGIFKQPVEGRIMVRRLNLDGDRQADLSVHGGPDKAVYGYPSEHYRYWRETLARRELGWGQFGENLTLSGLDEHTTRIGDRFRVGSAELIVTQPRTPCYKLGIRFGRADMVRLFQQSGRTGLYFAVAEEGTVEAGDPLILLERAGHGVTVADLTALSTQDGPDPALLERALTIDVLPLGWHEYIRELLQKS